MGARRKATLWGLTQIAFSRRKTRAFHRCLSRAISRRAFVILPDLKKKGRISSNRNPPMKLFVAPLREAPQPGTFDQRRLIRRARLAPQLLGRYGRAFRQALHLHPAECRIHRTETGKRSEAAI